MLDFSGSCGNEAPPQCGVLYIRSWHIKRFKGCSQGYNKNCNVYEGTRQKLHRGFFPLRGGAYPPTPVRKNPLKTAIFGQKNPILALFDTFFGENYR